MTYNNNWTDPFVFSLEKNFTTGRHFMEIYGAEPCCDYGNDIRYYMNDTGPFSINDFFGDL